VIGPAAARAVVSHTARISEGRELLVATVAAHLRVRVPLGDEPRTDACRHFSHGTGLEPVEPNAVDLIFPWRLLDADLHLALIAANTAPGVGIAARGDRMKRTAVLMLMSLLPDGSLIAEGFKDRVK